ncbi:VOC family protein [Streptomyces rapamycinicus]|uniref:Hydrolase n=2 Tax=Streptomyces rapamycinicus TaxID=1226757 RepID=A0A0A0NEN2_STRRN|nr:VOC family protein [Streptomyces rapamycinicus]AGP55716.1 hydrolase [Streptomyces rapamycinicus NRRL 5491]MBB4783281.1 putative enzyme related to lactoylglutathione lyase [Streptomyces rapamycinicus]RLV81244.1 hydrolase [Streptomyces rapamycinicus NRRL 5491]UTO63692.1 VOC family protein [Streptomyces rapamycinicus]UTP31646.1 VOC family protein [Streptomyces rapamycinicus NRRL 5491]
MAAFAEGVPCWTDVLLSDLAAGRRFYGELFGWTFQEIATEYGTFTRALLGGKDVAGLVPKPDGRMPTVWNIYFAAQDAAATAVRIREAGGRVITPPVWIDEFCVMATAADPGGAVFGVWQAGSHTGFARRGTPGSYGWTEVHTRQPRAVDAFYRAVFGYGMTPSTPPSTEPSAPPSGASPAPPSAEGAPADVVLWTPSGEPPDPRHAIGGRVVMGEEYPAVLPAHFLTYFVVADCDQALRTAHRLGGRVLKTVEDAPYGRFAVLADNQGAAFAVIDTSTAG